MLPFWRGYGVLIKTSLTASTAAEVHILIRQTSVAEWFIVHYLGFGGHFSPTSTVFDDHDTQGSHHPC